MKAYHMSETLNVGDILKTDYQELANLAQPFIQALQRSLDCFYGMVLNGKYVYAVLDKFGLREWADYAKWSTEGVFEFIRKTEFPHAVSRLKCNYFYDDLDNVKRLFEYDWENEPEEVKNKIRLFEVELNDGTARKYDMTIFNRAYDAMEKNQDIEAVFACARRYFSGEHSQNPIWEILTERNIRVDKDVTNLLH